MSNNVHLLLYMVYRHTRVWSIHICTYDDSQSISSIIQEEMTWCSCNYRNIMQRHTTIKQCFHNFLIMFDNSMTIINEIWRQNQIWHYHWILWPHNNLGTSFQNVLIIFDNFMIRCHNSWISNEGYVNRRKTSSYL